LLNRIRERDELATMGLEQTKGEMVRSLSKWGEQPSLVEETRHLRNWIDVLDG
jgi:hypothetical protein